MRQPALFSRCHSSAATVALAALALIAGGGLGGCVNTSAKQPMPNYQPEAFNGSAYVRHFGADAAHTCEAARRALLSQGYLLGAADASHVVARKYFQPGAEHHVQLEFNVVCTEAPTEPQRATIAFVSALKEQYALRKTKDAASVRLGGIGAVSVPMEGSSDAMVKVSSETISDATLYERFFTIMGDFLGAPPTAAATLPATQRKSASAAARSTRSQRQRANAWASTDADTLDAEARDELWLGEEPNEALAWEKEERGSNHTARRAFHKRSSTAKKSRTRRALRR